MLAARPARRPPRRGGSCPCRPRRPRRRWRRGCGARRPSTMPSRRPTLVRRGRRGGRRRGGCAGPGGTTASSATHASTGSSRPSRRERAERACSARRWRWRRRSRRRRRRCRARPCVWSRLAVLTTSPIAVQSPAGAQGADEHLAGVDPDAHLQARPPPASARHAASVRCMRSPARTARSASSSWAVGAPKRATMRVADDLVDPAAEVGDVGGEALEAAVDEVLHLLGIACARPGVVNPTRSAKRTVTTRRSSARADERLTAGGAEAGALRRNRSAAPAAGSGRAPPTRRGVYRGTPTNDFTGNSPVTSPSKG